MTNLVVASRITRTGATFGGALRPAGRETATGRTRLRPLSERFARHLLRGRPPSPPLLFARAFPRGLRFVRRARRSPPPSSRIPRRTRPPPSRGARTPRARSPSRARAARPPRRGRRVRTRAPPSLPRRAPRRLQRFFARRQLRLGVASRLGDELELRRALRVVRLDLRAVFVAIRLERVAAAAREHEAAELTLSLRKRPRGGETPPGSRGAVAEGSTRRISPRSSASSASARAARRLAIVASARALASAIAASSPSIVRDARSASAVSRRSSRSSRSSARFSSRFAATSRSNASRSWSASDAGVDSAGGGGAGGALDIGGRMGRRE